MTTDELSRQADWRARLRIIDVSLQMGQLRINHNKAGNVSQRLGERMVITPSGVPYDSLKPTDLSAVDLATSSPSGPYAPSSEWRFHRDIYVARPEVMAIVHTHSLHATALSVHTRSIEALHYMVAAGGGVDIRCAPYATFGSQELSENALIALEGRKACLLAHHGVIACGSNLSQALALAVEVENLAEMALAAMSIDGAAPLPNDEMLRVMEKFRSYGQRKPQTKN